MNYGTIKEFDVANCKGVGSSIFVSGCRNRCKGCFQPETWSFDYGVPYTDETEQKILTILQNENITSFSFLGGDPFEPENLPDVTKLATKINEVYPGKVLYAWTGRLFEELVTKEEAVSFLKKLDYLIDGPYIEEKRCLEIPLMGSTNQRILNCPESLKQKRAVEVKYEDIAIRK